MKSATIFELRDWDVEIRFWDCTEDVEWATRALTIRLEGAIMNILEHWELIEKLSLARKILNEC